MFHFDPAEVLATVRGNRAFTLCARFWTARVAFKMGDERYVLDVRDGEVVDFQRDDSRRDANITISGPADSWGKLLERKPPPGFQDPLFVAGKAGFQVEGDTVAEIGPYFYAVQEFIDVLRQLRSGGAAPEPPPEVDRDFDDAVGRYMYVHVEGVQYRIYYEEAGRGKIPLLLQHTAGSDGRQWRHLLEDPDYQKLYRIISYDLPFHGRSLPPSSRTWWQEPYKLTRSFLMEAVIAISKKLKLDRPVFMGCSIGGMLASDLAFYHPQEFRAVIGVNGALGCDETQRQLIRSAWERWPNPRVGPQWTMALIRSNTAPTSPEAWRRETTWVYSQAAPTINEGDIYYYAHDHDLTAEQAAQIDTSVVAVYLLTGAYDGLALDQGAARLAAAIRGSHFQVVPGLGHFGPSENPEGIKPALLPILQEIAQASISAAV